MAERIFVGGGGIDYADQQGLTLKYANRHGLVAGATGTGKTVTLQILAEGFSAKGVPVFLSDVKGDLSGLSKPGSADSKLHDAFTKRADTIGFQDFAYSDYDEQFFWIRGNCKSSDNWSVLTNYVDDVKGVTPPGSVTRRSGRCGVSTFRVRAQWAVCCTWG